MFQPHSLPVTLNSGHLEWMKHLKGPPWKFSRTVTSPRIIMINLGGRCAIIIKDNPSHDIYKNSIPKCWIEQTMGCSHKACVILFVVFLAVGSSLAQSPPAPAPVDGFGPMAAAPAPSDGCFDALLNMSDCLTFVENGSTVATPDKGCCPALSNLVATNPICLCQLLGKNPTIVGIQIDVNKAISLPKLCRVDTPPVSLCSVAGVDVSLPPGSEGPTMPGAYPPGGMASPPALTPGLTLPGSGARSMTDLSWVMAVCLSTVVAAIVL